jgi:light-regulated signal transduction histidine kinase (bacteriophytochrome)
LGTNLIGKVLTRQGEGMVEATGVDGIARLYAFIPLVSAGQAGELFVTIGIPAATVYAPANRALVRNLVGLGIVTVLALAFAWWLGQALVLRSTIEEKDRLYEEMRQQKEALQVSEERSRNYAGQLERSNRDLQEFAYVASHDLQEPLRKILAFGDRLTTHYKAALDETGQDYLARMLDASRRMQILINDLLTYSRVATQAQPFVRVDLARVAADVVADLEHRIEQAKGRVEIGPLPTIDADPTQIHQLLQNLVGNALKFHRPDAPPVVKVYAHEGGERGARNGERQEATLDASRFTLHVEDNGIGFDPKYTDRIFKPFQRLHSRNDYEGAGMGLAICRRIVERHDGIITAVSAPGQGATFIVTLPLRQAGKQDPSGCELET